MPAAFLVFSRAAALDGFRVAALDELQAMGQVRAVGPDGLQATAQVRALEQLLEVGRSAATPDEA